MPQHPETGLSEAEKAKKLLAGNFVNIGKKVLEGQTLSVGEVKLLEGIASQPVDHKPAANEPAFAKNKVQLANILGVSRKTIQRYSALDDCPAPRPNGSLSVADWRAYLASKEVIDGGENLDAASLKAQQILLQNQRLSNKLAQERQEWIPKVVCRQVFTELLTETKARSFNSVIRLVTLARVAPDTTAAAEEVRKEMEQLWKSLEGGEWFKPSQTTSDQATPKS